MENTFNLKKFLAEGALLKETKNILEIRSGDLKKIFDLYSQNTVNQEFNHLDDESKQQVQDAFNEAKYNTIDELIDSIYNVEGELADIMGHYPADFIEQTAEQLAEICNDINFKYKLEFLHAFLKRYWEDLYWPEDEQEESWNEFIGKN